MRGRKAALLDIGVDRIVAALDGASRVWLEAATTPSHRLGACLDAVAKKTGMSRQMVDRAVLHEMESSLASDMEAALDNELGDRHCLDRFVYSPKLRGETHAIGPMLVGGIVSANIPALPHLTVMRSLLVKAPCIVKTSVSEPHFLPAYAQTLYEIDPDVGRCLAVVNFGREDDEALDALLSGIDFLIAYGGLDAIANLKARKPANLRALFHGHKLGFAMVAKAEHGKDVLRWSPLSSPPSGGSTAGRIGGEEGVAELASLLAYDIVLFDQEACLAPHVIFVEGGFETACALAKDVAVEMGKLARDLPLGDAPLSRRMAIRQELDAIAMSAAGPTAVFAAEPCTAAGSARGGAAPAGFVVVQRIDKFEPSPLGRFVRVCPVASLDDALALVAPLGDLLQNVAVAAPPDRFHDIALRLARMGACRICPPGNMGTPTMMWHHDGKGCLAAMVRFTDIEVRGGMRKPIWHERGPRVKGRGDIGRLISRQRR